MGRKTKTLEEKKGKLSITISETNYNELVDTKMNKSKLINWLLEKHFKSLNNGK